MEIRKIFAVVMFVLYATLFYYSCSKEEDKLVFSGQETSIQNYVESQNARYEAYGSGVWRIILEEGDPDILVARGSKIKIDYALYQFNSRTEPIYTNKGTSTDDEDWLAVGHNELLEGLDIGIIGAGLNEKCQIMFSARYGFGNKQVGVIPKMTPLLIELIVKEIKTD